jgi:ABC-type antimicrobial peptide transport system permease subunit
MAMPHDDLARRRLARLLRGEDGAVTVDFIVLTAVLIAAVIGLFTMLTEELYQNAAMNIVEEVEKVNRR